MKTKKLTSVLLASLMVAGSLTTGASALTMTYTPSSSYRNSSYYTSLTNVQLTGNYNTDLLNVALSQVGYRESNSYSHLSGGSQGNSNCTEYGRWYGMQANPWCAMFISWAARQAGIPKSVIKNASLAAADYFGVNFQARSSGYVPQPGDLIFFGYTYGSAHADHVGIVVEVSNNRVTTVEGNADNKVSLCSYSLGSSYINGYGTYSPSFGTTNSVPSVSSSETEPYSEVVDVLRSHIGFKATLAENKKIDAFNYPGDPQRCGRVYETDVFTVNEIVYKNKVFWAKLSCPWDGGYNKTVYVRFEDVVPGFSSYNAYSGRAKTQITTYKHWDRNSTTGYIGSGDTVYVVAEKNGSSLVLYPLAGGGWKLGWM